MEAATKVIAIRTKATIQEAISMVSPTRTFCQFARWLGLGRPRFLSALKSGSGGSSTGAVEGSKAEGCGTGVIDLAEKASVGARGAGNASPSRAAMKMLWHTGQRTLRPRR